MLRSISEAGDDNCWWNIYRVSCWGNDSDVNAEIGTALWVAQQSTAHYLYALNLPAM